MSEAGQLSPCSTLRLLICNDFNYVDNHSGCLGIFPGIFSLYRSFYWPKLNQEVVVCLRKDLTRMLILGPYILFQLQELRTSFF